MLEIRRFMLVELDPIMLTVSDASLCITVCRRDAERVGYVVGDVCRSEDARGVGQLRRAKREKTKYVVLCRLIHEDNNGPQSHDGIL